MRRTLNENTIILSKKKYKEIISRVLEQSTSDIGVFLSDEIFEIAQKQIKIKWKSSVVVLTGSVGTGVVSSTLKAGEPILISKLYKEVGRIYRDTLDKYTLSLYSPISKLEIERLEFLRILLGSSTLELMSDIQLIGVPLEVDTTSLRDFVLERNRIGTVVQSLISKGFIRKHKNLKYSITANGYKYFTLKKHHLTTVMPPTSSFLTPTVISSISSVVKASISSTIKKMGMEMELSEIVEHTDKIELKIFISPTDITGGEVFWRGKWYRILGELGGRAVLQGKKNMEHLTLNLSTLKRLDIKKRGDQK